jgi:hypothetical protein
MAAVSYSINRGIDGFRQSDYTHGVLAPGANDIELRVNTTDGQGAPMSVKSVIIALDAFRRAVEDGTMFRGDFLL